MTEESYLPPDMDRPSRSEIMPCEPNAAQTEERSRWSFAICFGLIVMGTLLVGIGNSPEAAKKSLMAFVPAGLFALIGMAQLRRDRKRMLESLKAIYPDGDGETFTSFAIDTPLVGSDGGMHQQDHGFLTLEGDFLRWRGAWFQMLIHRQDIRLVVISGYWEGSMIFLHKGVLGDAIKLSALPLPNGRKPFGLRVNPIIRDWVSNGQSR